MDQKHIVIGLLAIIAIILIYMHLGSHPEEFKTKREKAQAIFDWFNKHPNPSYVDYKHDLNRASNIVEYEDVLGLFQNRNLTVDSVENTI